MTIGIVSVLFTIIVENTLKLGERYFALQIGVYILIVYLLVIILLALWSIWSGFNTFFWVVAIVGISGLIALRVLSKKEVHAELSDEEEYVRISKKEYEYLLNRSKLLDELTAKEEE